jgi:hypothetical protein
MKKYEVWTQNDLNSNDLDHDYDIEKNDDAIVLTYSKSKDWSQEIRGKVCAFLYDDGDEIKIKFENKKITLSYNELCELKCLLLFENKDVIEVRETNTIKKFV